VVNRISKAIRFCAAVSLALASGGVAHALDPNHKLTQYLHRIWQTQGGLSQASIYVVTQTHDGYIWVGTQSGVARFNGIEFNSIRALESNSLGEAWVRGLAEDSAGRMWMTTNDSQLVRVTGTHVKIFGESDGLYSKVSCLVRGSGDDMWACTATGLVHIQGDKFDTHQSPEQIFNRPISGCRASDGKIWIAGGDLLAYWDGWQFSRVTLKSVTGNLDMRSVLCNADGIWIGTEKGLVHYNAGAEKLYTARDGLADDVILSLGHGQDGTIWAGTRSGFSRMRHGTFESYGYREGLSQNTVYWLFEDREGSLWVATKNGLNQFVDGAATRYDKSEGLSSDNMGPVFQDRRGILWAGSLDGGLSRFNGRFFTPLSGFPKGQVTTLIDDSSGDLWAGTSQGAIHLKDGQVKDIYTTAQGLPANRIRSMFRDQGGRLWAGTEKGPAIFEGGRFIPLHFSEKELSGPIAAIGETREGSMLFAAARGNIYLSDEDGVQKLAGPPNVSPLEEINAIYMDRDGIVWMGAEGNGLGMLRNGKLYRFLIRDGLYDGEIYGFVSDAQDRLWMACAKGFFWVDRKELLKFADGKISKFASVPYRPLDGLRTLQGTPGVQPVGVRRTDGTLWFSATGLLLAFEPNQGVRPGSVPPVVIEVVTINGKDLDPATVRTLGPGRTNVDFQYTALTYLAPNRVTFRYILEGYDKDWINAGPRREAAYTNLPPGKFRFRVIACGAFVNCNETGSALDFEIAPVFYQRTWFIPSCVLLAALLVWLFYRFRMQHLRSQFVLVLAERSRIARELHDTLIQGFSGITMQMHAFASRLKTPEDRQALGEIIHDAGICLQETRRSVAGLRGGTGSSSGLAAAISDAARQLTEERDIRLKLSLDERHQELSAEVKYNLVCIVQEAITNSIKHSGAHVIEVSLVCSANDLRISVRDDGRGISLGEGKGRAGHYGMIGMKERASQIGAELDIASAPGQGTKVSVYVPVSAESPVPSPHRRLEPI
jgi:ligand-binding sensor domain-containing protein/anti-sigma regulatory factor (Ser/Thr protein kinase)